MSLSTGSSSSEDDFTTDQPEITAEVNGPSITSWTIITENPTETDSSAQQQQRQQMMSMLALCHGEYNQQKFQCQKKEKIAKLEEEKEQQKKKNEKYVSADQFIKMENDHFALLKRISELEKQQLKQQKQQAENGKGKYASEKFTKLQDDQQQTNEEETNGLEKGQQQKMLTNGWDANFCHSDLEIIGNECLTVHHIGDAVYGHRSVYAKHPIFLLKNGQNDSTNCFYFEISIKKMKNCAAVGFTTQRQVPSNAYLYALNGTYAYVNRGILWKNGSFTIGTERKCSYGAGDTVGCGIDLVTRKIFFTKNGIRLDRADLRLYLSIPSDVGQLFPFVSLCDSDDKIETNFGPNFMPISPKTSIIWSSLIHELSFRIPTTSPPIELTEFLIIIFLAFAADICGPDICGPDICGPDICGLLEIGHLRPDKRGRTFAARTFAACWESDICGQRKK
ncbi:hypothetical protein niasHS_015687 [Heterodera schachtii]|uniref:B30.2/SPRY domain-containing protein n=1 Tax=Heterodera schachtii TaxID=97005 RepID=A0ABD2HU93_HETSC